MCLVLAQNPSRLVFNRDGDTRLTKDRHRPAAKHAQHERPKNLSLLLLAIYLILVGSTMFFHTIAIPVVVMGILALAAGILILIGR